MVTDETSSVEYIFLRVGVPDHNSGWQEERTFSDTGLVPGTEYTYTIIARDAAGNKTNEAPYRSATTLTGVFDNNEPMPWPTIVGTETLGFVGAGGNWFNTVTCTIATDESGTVEYYFDCITINGVDSGWISFADGETPSWTTWVAFNPASRIWRVRAREVIDNVPGLMTPWSDLFEIE